MRILLVVIFGIILAACGQSYEEIEGYKIGAPLADRGSFEADAVDYAYGVSGDMVFYYKNNKDSFFNKITIIEYEGKVSLVSLSRNLADPSNEQEKKEMEDYIRNFMLQSKDRWGELEPDLDMPDLGVKIWSASVGEDKNEIIGGVILTKSDDYSHLTIDYIERDFYTKLLEAEKNL